MAWRLPEAMLSTGMVQIMQGRKSPSGLYIYALQVKTQLIAKRMLLVK
jgi:hypothetical protein